MNKACQNSHEHLQEFDTELIEIICKRGLCEKGVFEDFVNPVYAKLHGPFLFNDMKKATERILQALKENEKVVIYSDFDADGIPAGIILKELFNKVGFDNFSNYIPHRNKEGYGFHKEAVEKFAKEGVNLIITVDVGIGAKEAVTHAKEKGIDVIITDHHEAPSRLPDAFAIINPKVEGEKYPFDGLCGAGVAFKLVQALIQEGKNQGIRSFLQIKDGWEKWLLDLVAIATVSDMVPLVGENRILVYWGLVVLRKTRRAGLNAFFKRFRINKNVINESDIGFSIAPKINASSRMGDPRPAFELLSCADISKALEIANRLDALNKKRQTEVAKITREAKKRYKMRETVAEVFVTGEKSWHTALLGLSAGKLADEFGKMVCLWGKDESGVYRGSCRNGGQGHVAKLFEKMHDVLNDAGGHEGAGGFSVDFEHLVDLEQLFNDAYCKLDLKQADERTEYDADLSLSKVNWRFYNLLRTLAPFGIGNPVPSFHFNNIKVVSKKLFGKNKEHLELILSSLQGKERIKAVAFFAPETWKSFKNVKSVTGHIEASYFLNKPELRISITQMR